MDDGHRYKVGMCRNCWVIPYNPFCILWLSCHINVECALFFASMKCINKYLNKGGDHGTLQLQAKDDEVYIDGRYFSAAEAAWRIFQFPLHDQHPNIIHLPIHLPNEQCVVFDSTLDANCVVEYAENMTTILMAFFNTNNMDDETGHLARHIY